MAGTDGPVLLLTTPSSAGYHQNPISVYYCFSAAGDLPMCLAEVTNTPWGEHHAYVLPAQQGSSLLHASFDKQMHVSPFNPMTMRYRWTSRAPQEHLGIHLENHMNGSRVFDATLSLRREPINRAALARLLLLRFPLISLKIAGAIYWEALRLFLKRVPFHAHPGAPLTTDKETL